MNSTYSLSPVTITGLGPMGRTMARTLMTAGRQVTVWNRTPSRTDEPAAAAGAIAAGRAGNSRTAPCEVIRAPAYLETTARVTGAGPHLTGKARSWSTR